MYSWLPLNSGADLAQLKAQISSEYNPGSVAKKLEGGISTAVKAILIERNYIDKDYRSTFYHFYAKKGGMSRSLLILRGDGSSVASCLRGFLPHVERL